MSIFSWFKQGDARAKTFKERDEKLEESQQFLIDAAVAINDVAGALTEQIRRRYENDMQFEATSNVIEDALIICSLANQGVIQHANEVARSEFGGDISHLDVSKMFAFGDNREFDDINGLFNYLFVAEGPLGVRVDGKTFPICLKMERLNWIDGSSSMMILLRRVSASQSEPIDLSFDGILVVQEDHIVAANPSVQAIFGYEDASLLGQPLSSLFPKEKAERIRMVSDTGERHLIGTHDDGHPLHLKLATVHVNKMFNDVTARLVTVKPVEPTDNAERFQTDNGIDMFVSFTPDGVITFANSTFAATYGFKRSEIVSKNMKDVLPSAEYDTLKINMSAMSPQKSSLRVQLHHARDGHPTALHDWIWYATFDKQGNVIEFHRTGRDISEIVSNIVTSGYF